MSYASRIIALRKKIGISQAELAREFGVTPAALSFWESGKREVPDTILKLIEIYEEFMDEDLALKRQDEAVRELAISWSRRLLPTFANGARRENRKRIEKGLEKSLYSFFRHELSAHQVKRNLQVTLFNRVVDIAARSKGLPMKLVQVMTFLNPGMNQVAREALEKIHLLQYPMAPTLVAKIIYEDFGQSPSKLFAEWSPQPLATASIGQVHLARLKTGERVAVKVQYRDIQKSLESDLKTLGVFREFISAFHPEARAIINEVGKTIINEADYYREREYLETFHELFSDNPNVIIPKSYGRYCSSRVLTMDYIEGLSLAEFKSVASYEERKIAAETLATFTTATAFKAGVMNTDTNSGNFIFCPGGRVGFIDFGRAEKIELAEAGAILIAVIQKNEDLARAVLPKIFPMKERVRKEGADYPFNEVWNFFLSQQIHLYSGEFRFTRQHIEKTLSAGQNFFRSYNLQLSLEAVWSLATSTGLWNVLADLDVAVDYGRVSMDVLSGLEAPENKNLLGPSYPYCESSP